MNTPQEYLRGINSFQCAVLGEYIEDEYVTVTPLSMIQSLRAYEEIKHEVWAGGAAFIAHQLAALGAIVGIECRGGARKTRYLTPEGQKVFSVAKRRKVKSLLSPSVPPQKYIICADYGHGAFDWDYINLLCASDRFIALTVQLNSLNRKFNFLSKWPRADYVVINQEEFSRSNVEYLSLPDFLKQESNRLHAKLFVVTRGANPLWAYGDERMWKQKAPKKNVDVIDSMGAGDTFLAVTTPLVIMGAPIETILQIGSVAAGLHCGKRGNPTLKKEELFESL